MEENKTTEEKFRHFTHHQTGGIIHIPSEKMKINKNIIISIIIVVVTLAAGGYLLLTKKDSLLKKESGNSPLSSVQLKFSEKNFKLNYASLAKDFVIYPVHFERDEVWQGTYDFDDVNFREGTSSLVVISKDNEKIDVYLDKKLDLRKYQVFKISVFLQTNPIDTESVRLYFANSTKTAYYAYPITNLAKGWNFLTIPKLKISSVNAAKINLINPKTSQTGTTAAQKSAEGGILDWGKIERIGLEVVSRSNSVTTINFDDLRVLENEDFMDDWLTVSPLFLELVKTADDRIILQVKDVGASTALIKKLSGLSSFNMKVKLQSQKASARSGLFIKGDYKTGYGYYFLVDGLNGSRWQILKYGLVDEKPTLTTLKNGVINNFMVEENKPLWIKVESRGDNMKFHLSTDNKSYTMLGEINDSEFKEGGVGISVMDSGMTLFDDFEFNQ